MKNLELIRMSMKEPEEIGKEVESFLASNWKNAFEMWLWCILDIEKVVMSLRTMPYPLLYQAGVESGKRAWVWLRENFNLEEKGVKERTYYTNAYFSSSGVGEIEFRKDLGERVLRFKHGTFLARKQGLVGRKVCHFVAGFIAGLTTSLTGEKYTVDEFRCVSKGDEHCDFVVRRG